MQANLATTHAVSPENSDTQLTDRVSLSNLAYDFPNLGIADFKLVRYLANFLLAEPFPTKFLLRSYNRLGNRHVVDALRHGLSLASAFHNKFDAVVGLRVNALSWQSLLGADQVHAVSQRKVWQRRPRLGFQTIAPRGPRIILEGFLRRLHQRWLILCPRHPMVPT